MVIIVRIANATASSAPRSKAALKVPADSSRASRILDLVRAIPKGFVQTYGDIDPHAPRLVGHILATTERKVPWHRVVRSDGGVTQGRRQLELLRKEGVPLRGKRVDLIAARLPRGITLGRSRAICAIAAVSFLAFFRPDALFAETAPPIHINSCDVKKLHSEYGLGNLFIKGKGYNFFNITFTNTSKEIVKHIVFQIEFEKSRYVVADAGSFAPGQQVTHHLRDHGKDVQAHARAGSGPTECSVLAVTFSDGTAWP